MVSLKYFTPVLVIAFAWALGPMILPFLMRLNLTAPDETIRVIPLQSAKELATTYAGKKALLIGGTRGVGFGTALALAQAGADVTLVGRSAKSGQAALDKIRAATASNNSTQNLEYIQGDIGSLASVNQLVDTLASRPERYDYLVVSAMTFPDWSAETTMNEDGFDQSYFIAVIGRFFIYRNMHKFLVGKDSRVLNVLVAGEKPMTTLDRDFCSGKRGPKSLLDDISNIATAEELMLISLQDKDPNIGGKVTFVSTHPGMLKTDLHRGQGWLFDVIEAVLVSLIGVSEEDCGMRQASILASDKLHDGKLSYVDLFMEGRTRSPRLQAQVDESLDWLWDLLTSLEQKPSDTVEDVAASD